MFAEWGAARLFILWDNELGMALGYDAAMEPSQAYELNRAYIAKGEGESLWIDSRPFSQAEIQDLLRVFNYPNE